MPKWWAISCTTVIRTSSRSCSSVSQQSSSGPRKTKIRSGRPRRHGAVALGQRHAVVEPEQVVGLVLGRLVLDQHDDVAHQGGELVGDLVEGSVDQRVEALGIHVDRHGAIIARAKHAETPNAPGIDLSRGRSALRPRRDSNPRPPP